MEYLKSCVCSDFSTSWYTPRPSPSIMPYGQQWEEGGGVYSFSLEFCTCTLFSLHCHKLLIWRSRGLQTCCVVSHTACLLPSGLRSSLPRGSTCFKDGNHLLHGKQPDETSRCLLCLSCKGPSQLVLICQLI